MVKIINSSTTVSFFFRYWRFNFSLNTILDENSSRILLKDVYNYFHNNGLVLSKNNNNTLLFKIPYFSGDFDASFRGIIWIKVELIQKEGQCNLRLVYKIFNYHLWFIGFSLAASYIGNSPLMLSNIQHFLYFTLLLYIFWNIPLFFIIIYGLYSTAKRLKAVVTKSISQNL